MLLLVQLHTSKMIGISTVAFDAEKCFGFAAVYLLSDGFLFECALPIFYRG